jgi:hypothetical protein
MKLSVGGNVKRLAIDEDSGGAQASNDDHFFVGAFGRGELEQAASHFEFFML